MNFSAALYPHAPISLAQTSVRTWRRIADNAGLEPALYPQTGVICDVLSHINTRLERQENSSGQGLSSSLLKGGIPAAPSGTATLLRLSPSHRFYPKQLPP